MQIPRERGSKWGAKTWASSAPDPKAFSALRNSRDTLAAILKFEQKPAEVPLTTGILRSGLLFETVFFGGREKKVVVERFR